MADLTYDQTNYISFVRMFMEHPNVEEGDERKEAIKASGIDPAAANVPVVELAIQEASLLPWRETGLPRPELPPVLYGLARSDTMPRGASSSYEEAYDAIGRMVATRHQNYLWGRPLGRAEWVLHFGHDVRNRVRHPGGRLKPSQEISVADAAEIAGLMARPETGIRIPARP